MQPYLSPRPWVARLVHGESPEDPEPVCVHVAFWLQARREQTVDIVRTDDKHPFVLALFSAFAVARIANGARGLRFRDANSRIFFEITPNLGCIFHGIQIHAEIPIDALADITTGFWYADRYVLLRWALRDIPVCFAALDNVRLRPGYTVRDAHAVVLPYGPRRGIGEV